VGRRVHGPALTIGVTVAISVNLSKILDKAYEGSSVTELLDAPVSALSGVSDADAEHLAAAFNIKTIRDLGTNKYFAAAGALVELGGHEG
jgi:hypothetical protein